MAEWSIAAVLKTVVPRGTRGSNPCLSAVTLVKSIFYGRFFISESKITFQFTESMDEMELMMRLHLNNKRQGPGSEETTLLALQLTHIDRNKSYRIADIGCGTGAQTITLAKALRGEVIAIDLFDEFLHQLEKRVQNESLCATVSTMSASMDALPFQQEDFDIIWSEGAVYNMGFQRGIAYWKKFLKKGGILAVSELSWITKDRPADLEEFWNGEYAEMNTVSGKIKMLEDAGYKVLGHFILPEYCWMDNYYIPLLASHDAFLQQYGNEEMAHRIVDIDKKEVEFYKKYKDYYSYGFYVAQKLAD